MTSDRDKAKRWQFGMRDLIAAISGFCIPLIAWTWAPQLGASLLLKLIACSAGGIICSLMARTPARVGFVGGFCTGGVAVMVYVALVR